MKDIARRVNFFTATLLGVVGISLLSEVFQEDDFPDKIDDAIIFVLGLVAIWWYRKTGSKAAKSAGSVVLMGLGVLVKVLGVYVERGDKEALGDDIGVLVMLILAFGVVLWQTYIHKERP